MSASSDTRLIDIGMPRLSDSMEEATILTWLKRPGDAVTRGEPLVEVETDKATMVYEAETDRRARGDRRRRRVDRRPRGSHRAHPGRPGGSGAAGAARSGSDRRAGSRAERGRPSVEVEFRDAIRQALDEELARDERVFLFGEDVAARRRRVRGDAGPPREARARPGVRHADLRARDDGRRLRRRDHRQAAGARDHVRRLPRPVDGHAHQPGVEVLVPHGRQAGRPARDPLRRRRRRPLRGDPLADAGLVAHGHHRPEDRRARHPRGRKGPPQGGDPGREPGGVPRAQAPLLAQGRGRRRRGRPARARADRAGGLEDHARDGDEGRARLSRGRRPARRRRHRRGGRRPAHPAPARPRDRPRVGGRRRTGSRSWRRAHSPAAGRGRCSR